MSIYDVIIDNNNNYDFLTKTNFNINSTDNILKIDLSDKISINNYDFLGSTANSLAYLIEFDNNGKKVSRNFIYYNERIDTNSYNLNNSIISLLKYGYCFEEDYPYNPNVINNCPNDDIYKIAQDSLFKFDIIKLNKDINSLLLSLINNEPFIVSIVVYNENLTLPKSLNDNRLGAITIVVCGFDITKQVFIIVHLNKIMEIPLTYFIKDGLTSDCFIFVSRNFNINLETKLLDIEDNSIDYNNDSIDNIHYWDLRNKFPLEVYDQGKIGSCTANALCSIFEYDNNNFKGSRLFLYYNERLLINEVDKDSGAYLKDGITCLKLYGICHEKYWNYSIENLFIKPSYEAYKNAKKNYLIEAFNIPKNLKSIKYWLINNEPIAIAIGIFSNFMKLDIAKSGIVNMPDFINDKFLGGHAVVICGFDDKNERFILRNSWGNYWGDNGYFYLPYDYLLNSNQNLCGNDFWIITKSKFDS